MESVDLGYPFLFAILFFWAFLALAGILTTLSTKSKVGDRLRKFKSKFYDFSHKRHYD